MNDLARDEHSKIDALEQASLAGVGAGELRPVELPLTHRFTPGLYAREIFMPAGTLLTSKIHNTEHPFVVLSGCARVYIPGEGARVLRAGHVGITKPGTRRVLYIEEDCRWITFHPLADGESGEADLEAIEARIIEPHLLPGGENANELYREALKMLSETPGPPELVGAP